MSDLYGGVGAEPRLGNCLGTSGCAREDGSAVESSGSRTAGKAGGQRSVRWKGHRVLWSKTQMLPSFGITRMLCQSPGAAPAQPSQSQKPQLLQLEISVMGKR